MVKALTAPVTVSAGAGVDVSKMGSFTVYLFGTLVGTWQLQVSPDGANWVNEGAALTAAGDIAVTKQCAQVRWNCTAFTSGAPTSQIDGANLDTL